MYLHTLTLCLAKPHTHSPMHSLTNSLTHSLTHYLSLTGADEACSTAPTEGWGDGLRSEHAAGEARETDHTASRVWEAPDGSERTAEAATDTAGGTGVVTMTTDHAHNQPAGENNTVPRHCLSELKNQHNLHTHKHNDAVAIAFTATTFDVQVVLIFKLRQTMPRDSIHLSLSAGMIAGRAVY